MTRALRPRRNWKNALHKSTLTVIKDFLDRMDPDYFLDHFQPRTVAEHVAIGQRPDPGRSLHASLVQPENDARPVPAHDRRLRLFCGICHDLRPVVRLWLRHTRSSLFSRTMTLPLLPLPSRRKLCVICDALKWPIRRHHANNRASSRRKVVDVFQVQLLPDTAYIRCGN